MARSKRLQPIKEIAQNHEKAAAQQLGESQEKMRLEQQKLEQLEGYRREYLSEMDNKVRQGMSADSLQRYHHFLAKLDQAVNQQQQVLQTCLQQIEDSQGQWQDKRSRHQAIGQVMDNLASKEHQAQAKKESNQLDEMSTQAFLRRHSS